MTIGTKMKKFIVTAMSLILLVCTAFGCGGREGDTEDIDSSRTQLYVGFYYSGLGKEWIQQAKTVFEEKYAEVSFENNKKGVQVILDLDKAGLNGGSLLNTIGSSRDQVFFIENGDYYSFVNSNKIADITDVVTAAADGETATIESKLDDRSKSYYNLDGKYYAMPYYEGYMGINYNVDLFEDNNFYFAFGKSAEGLDLDDPDTDYGDLFITNANDQKSVGVDGIENTYDDGLPATYNDFKALLLQIKSYGDTPLIWCGNYLTYLIEFSNLVWTDFEGAEQMALNWSMDGTATDIVDHFDNGVPVLKDATTINGSNGYLLQQQLGKYYALQFAKMCVEDSNYYYKDSFSSSLTHIDAQRRFVKGGTGNYENIAMLIDGNWWDVEATSQFDTNGSVKSFV